MKQDYLSSITEKDDRIFKKLGVKFEDVLKLPISYLELSKEVYEILTKGKNNLSHDLPFGVKTLKDLISFTEETLFDYFAGFYYNDRALLSKLKNSSVVGSDRSKIIYEKAKVNLTEVKEKLARFALKLKYSEFSVFDISVKALNVREEAKKWLKTHPELETIGDLYVLGTEGLNELAVNQYLIAKPIRIAMYEYGTGPERTSRNEAMGYEEEDEDIDKIPETIIKNGKLFPKITESLALEAEKHN